jgi:hypothetical protein
MIYKLLINTAWNELTIVQFEAISQYSDILVYSAE